MAEAPSHPIVTPSRGPRFSQALRATRRQWAKLVALMLGLAFTFGASQTFAQTVTPRIEAVYPHDATAFTEGLELFEGKLFESTGPTGKSVLRRVAVTTGAIEKNINLDSSLFGEGLTRIDRQLIQLTYTTGVAIVYDLDTFAELKRFTYTGQGWGLCYDGTELVMTNGSDKLAFRDPATFALRREVSVRQGGTSVANLNELECVGSLVYVNVFRTDNILRIDKATGNVLTQIDASALLTADEKKMVDVLNGIAYDEAKRRFYLTGKYWPKLFEVSFDFDPGSDGDAGADAGGSDAGDVPDASSPRDASRDATDAGTTPIDSGTPRDTGSSRDAAESGARDGSSSDASPADASVPPLDGSTPADGGNDQGGAGGASGGGAGSSGAGGGSKGGCACRSGGRPARGSWPATLALFGAVLLGRARRAARRR